MKQDRRTFTRTAAAMTAASYARVLGANDRIQFGIIGAGGRGTGVWRQTLAEAEVEPAAACDVYEPHLERALSLSAGRAKPYRDFRKLIEHKPLDAVIVATPDHWHALPTIRACQAGLDVWVEKPLSLTVREGRLMVEAARKYKRVVQVGSQQRSGLHYREAIDLIQGGALGEVHHVEAGREVNSMPGWSNEARTPAKLPADFDYDMWLGPAPEREYHPLRSIYHFRWFWEYSGGQMTNWGAHNIDIGRWGLGVESPLAVSAFGGRYAIQDEGETPDLQEVIYKLPNGVLHWRVRELSEGRGVYLTFQGTKATLDITRRGYRISTESWQGKPMAENREVRALGHDRNHDYYHVRNFLDCIRSRERPNADVEIGHRTAVFCHLGNIATRLGRTLQWDAENERVVGDEDANGQLHYEYRAPWRLDSV